MWASSLRAYILVSCFWGGPGLFDRGCSVCSRVFLGVACVSSGARLLWRLFWASFTALYIPPFLSLCKISFFLGWGFCFFFLGFLSRGSIELLLGGEGGWARGDGTRNGWVCLGGGGLGGVDVCCCCDVGVVFEGGGVMSWGGLGARRGIEGCGGGGRGRVGGCIDGFSGLVGSVGIVVFWFGGGGGRPSAP